jgi:peptidoglycan hydrolase CwlO-like protein
MSIYELGISLLIIVLMVAGVIFTRRDAAANARENPVSTKQLNSDISSLQRDVKVLRNDVDRICEEMKEAPTKADIAKLEERIAGIGGHIESVDAAVIRIENILLTGAYAAATAPATPVRRTRK